MDGTVQHFHRASFSVRYPDTAAARFAIARDKIVFAMAQTIGNIRTTELQGQK